MNDNYKFTVSADDKTISAFNSVNKNLKKTEGNFNRFNKNASGSLGGVGRNAGQASIQLQQFFGQVQGGVNPMVALSQQSADLGIVLGAPLLGSIAGISAALATLLLPQLFDSKKSTDELSDAMEALNKIASRNSGGVYEFTDAIRELSAAGKSAQLASLELGMIEAEKATKAATASIIESLSSIDADYGFGDIEGAVTQIQKFGFEALAMRGTAEIAQELGEEFGKTGKEASKLGQDILLALAQVEKAPTTEALTNLQTKLTELSTSGKGVSKEVKTIVGNLAEFFAQARSAGASAEFIKEQFKLLESGSGDFGAKQLEKSKSITQELAKELALAQLNLSGNTKEAEKLQAAFSAGLSSFEQLSGADQSLVNEISKVNAAIEENTRLEQAKAEAKATAKADTAREIALEQRKAETLASVNSNIYAQIIALEEGAKAAFEYNLAQQLGLETVSQIPEQLQLQIDKLYELKDAQLSAGESSDSFWENLKTHIGDTSKDFDTMWGNTFNSFASGIGDATSKAILEQQSFGDAAKGIARSAIQEIISGLVTIAVKKVALFALEKTLMAGATTANATAAGIQGGAAATAWAPAAAFASLATGGANSVPASSALIGTVALAETLGKLASFDGGGYTGDGPRIGGLDGKGGRLAMIHPQEDIFDRTKGQRQSSNTMNYSTVINGSGLNEKELINVLARDKKRFSRLVNGVIGVPM